jgi:hypothetical protein
LGYQQEAVFQASGAIVDLDCGLTKALPKSVPNAKAIRPGSAGDEDRALHFLSFNQTRFRRLTCFLALQNEPNVPTPDKRYRTALLKGL